MGTPSIYFYVLPVENGGYQHNLISLAQGLEQMGERFAGSTNYWKKASGDYLFLHDDRQSPQDFDVVVISEQYITYGNGQFPDGFFDLPGKKVYIHTGDGLKHQYNLGKLRSFYARFDLVLIHMYKGIHYPDNFKPWAFGISQHILDLSRPDLPKENKICLNYRNSHSVRRLASKRIFAQLPDEMIDDTREMEDWRVWKDSKNYNRFCTYQSAGRHSPGYNYRIGSSLGTACFGGVFFIKPWIWNWPFFKVANYFVQSAASVGRMQAVVTKLGMAKLHSYRIFQWDSWRFWEAFTNKSVAIHVDLKEYGIILPETPINMKHYLGADLMTPEVAIKMIKDKALMRSIGEAGREWAIQHYAPVPQAKRFLDNL